MLRPREVQRQRSFVAVKLPPPRVPVISLVLEVSTAHPVQPPRVFDLDDVGASVSEETRGVRPGPVVGEIKYPHTVKSSRHYAVLPWSITTPLSTRSSS